MEAEKSMEELKIDVVICTKNSIKTLGFCLSNVFSFIPINRLIVVDGLSTDGTLEFVKKFADVLVSDKGRGLGFARSLGLTLVETEIFAFIDSDVFLPQNWFKKLILHFGNPKVAVVTGALIFGWGCLPLQRYYERFYRNPAYFNQGLNNALLKKSIVQKVGGIRDLPSSEDIDLKLRIEEKGYLWITERSVISRHPSNLTDYLHHSSWWARGLAMTGKFGLDKLKSEIWSLRRTPIMAIFVHPIFLIYYVLERLIWVRSFSKTLKEMYKVHKKNSFSCA